MMLDAEAGLADTRHGKTIIRAPRTLRMPRRTIKPRCAIKRGASGAVTDVNISADIDAILRSDCIRQTSPWSAWPKQPPLQQPKGGRASSAPNHRRAPQQLYSSSNVHYSASLERSPEPDGGERILQRPPLAGVHVYIPGRAERQTGILAQAFEPA
jgi:hypothetical protein